MLCYKLEKKHDSFRIGCKAGVLDTSFQWNQLTKSELVTDGKMEEIPDEELSIRSAIIALSVGHGQGVLKCGCKKRGGKCSCLKAGQKCNSRCHGENKNKIVQITLLMFILIILFNQFYINRQFAFDNL